MMIFLVVVNILLLIINVVLIALIIYNDKGLQLPRISFKKGTLSISRKHDIKDLQEDMQKVQSAIENIEKGRRNLVGNLQNAFDKINVNQRLLENRINEVKATFPKGHEYFYQDSFDRPEPQKNTHEVVLDITTPKEEKKEESIYLKNFKDGILIECKETDAQFTATKESDSQISFYFSGNAATALATRNATFDDVCELQEWHSNVRKIIMIKNGTAQFLSDGKWKVSKLAQIKCE